ncbi:Hypothetical predicted protein, partial [Mytilus galloprovincialis]
EKYISSLWKSALGRTVGDESRNKKIQLTPSGGPGPTVIRILTNGESASNQPFTILSSGSDDDIFDFSTSSSKLIKIPDSALGPIQILKAPGKHASILVTTRRGKKTFANGRNQNISNNNQQNNNNNDNNNNTNNNQVFIKNYNANEPNSPSNTNSDDDEIDLGKGKRNTYSEMLLRSSAPPICLTWKTSNTHLTVECSVMSVNDDIIIVDPVGKVRAQHMWESNLHKRSTIHGIPLLFTTSKDYNEGKWSCRHGKEETTSQVSYTKSISPNIDIDISAENFKLKEGNWFKLACSSCWIPHMQGVDIFVNDKLEDSIRYQNGDCYHKQKLCTPEVCTCAAKGRIFTWTYISTLPIVQFACVMRFQDEIKYTTFNHKAEITFDGTVFIKNYNANEPHSPTDKSSDDDKIDSGKGGINTYLGGIGYWKLGIVVFAILGIAISIAILVWNHTQNRPH